MQTPQNAFKGKPKTANLKFDDPRTVTPADSTVHRLGR